MRLISIRTYITVGATLGVVLAIPAWQATLAGQKMPQNWPEAKPILFALTMATGHGVLRMYSWLPSLIYIWAFMVWRLGIGCLQDGNLARIRRPEAMARLPLLAPP